MFRVTDILMFTQLQRNFAITVKLIEYYTDAVYMTIPFTISYRYTWYYYEKKRNVMKFKLLPV